ncbi:MAG: right-handed parallel beta-helix repeat-containing protein, partial [Chloroflexota bacterium]
MTAAALTAALLSMIVPNITSANAVDANLNDGVTVSSTINGDTENEGTNATHTFSINAIQSESNALRAASAVGGSVPIHVQTFTLTNFDTLVNNTNLCPSYTFPYTVGTVNSDLAADLVAAIECANANATDDVIEFAGNVSLTDAFVFDETIGNTGTPIITSNITFNGNGYTLERAYTTFNSSDADPDFRLLNIDGTGMVTINALTLQNGYPAAQDGGVIYNSNGTVTINNSTLTNNVSRDGGAIDNGGGTVTINNSTLTNNNAPDGGAIYNNSGNVTVNNSTFSNNIADAFSGVIDNNGVLTVNNSAFADNDDTSLHNRNALVVTNTTFADNQSAQGTIVNTPNATATVVNSLFADEVGQEGAAVIYNRGTFTLTNSTIADSSATFFGHTIDNGNNPLTVNNSIIWGNTSDGAINDRGTSSVVVQNSIIEGGYAGTGNLDVDPLFTDAANGNYTLQAGSPAIDTGDNSLLPTETSLGVDVDGDGVTDDPVDVDIRNDDAIHPRFIGTVDMGAYELNYCVSYAFPYTLGTVNSDLAADLITAIECAEANATDDTIDLNGQTVTYTEAYSAAYNNEALPEITQSLTLQNGTMERDTGSGNSFRFIVHTGDLTLDNITLRNGGGGAITYGGAIYSFGPLTITNSAFFANSAVLLTDDEAGGGAIINVSSSLVIDNTVFDGNTTSTAAGVGGAIASATEDGTGLYPDTNLTGVPPSATITNAIFTNNEARVGGAVQLAGDTLVSSSTLTNNVGAFFGSAIYHQDGTFNLLNSTITDNTISVPLGLLGSSMVVMNTLITNNTTSNNTPGGMYVVNNATTSDVVRIVNTTIANNQSTTASANFGLSGGLYITTANGFATRASVQNSIISGNTDNNGNARDIVNSNATVTISNTLYGTLTDNGTTTAENNLVGVEPLFTDAANRDYTVQTGSPAIDAGRNALLPDETDLGADVDVDGVTDDPMDVDIRNDDVAHPRIVGGAVDMGTYETNYCANYTFPYTVGTADGSLSLDSDLVRAVNCANANATDDVIDLNGQTVTFTEAYADDVALPYITSTLTLQNGTIERDTAAPNFALLYLDSGGLIVDTITLKNGGDQTGSAVFNDSGTLLLSNVVVQNNNSTSNSGSTIGGDLGSDTTIVDSTITNNRQAIVTFGNLTIVRSNFTNNTGIVVTSDDGNVVVVNSRFTDNTGGYIFNLVGDDVLIANSLFADNDTGNFPLILNQAGTSANPTRFINNTIANNTTTNSTVVKSFASLRLENSILYGNSATYDIEIIDGALNVSHSVYQA